MTPDTTTGLVGFDEGALRAYLARGGDPGYPYGETLIEFSDTGQPGNAIERLFMTARDRARAIRLPAGAMVEVWGNDDSDGTGSFLVHLGVERGGPGFELATGLLAARDVTPLGEDVYTTGGEDQLVETVRGLVEVANRLAAAAPAGALQALGFSGQ